MFKETEKACNNHVGLNVDLNQRHYDEVLLTWRADPLWYSPAVSSSLDLSISINGIIIQALSVLHTTWEPQYLIEMDLTNLTSQSQPLHLIS